MRSTTWPAPTSVHDLQPGRRSLRLKGLNYKLGAAEIRTPIRGSGSVAPFHTPIRGSRDPFRCLLLTPIRGLGPVAPRTHPYTGFLATPFGVFLLTPIRGLGPWRQAPWPLPVTPTRGFATPFGVLFLLTPIRGLGPWCQAPWLRGVLRPLSGSCFFSPLSGVLLHHDEVVREPDILTGPAGLGAEVAEEW